MDDDLERVRDEAIRTDTGRTSMRGRILGWTIAIVVLLGVVASIPMIPIVMIGWFMAPSSFPATQQAAGVGAPGKLAGFSGALLFPIVAAGWLLIAFLGAGFVGGGFTGPGTGIPGLAWVAFLCLFIGPTLLVYRSIHPEIAGVPFDEWLGSRRPGPIGIAVLAWFACVLFIASAVEWIPFDVDVGATGFIIIFALVFCIPLVALPIAHRWPGRLLQVVALAVVFGIVTFLATVVGITPR